MCTQRQVKMAIVELLSRSVGSTSEHTSSEVQRYSVHCKLTCLLSETRVHTDRQTCSMRARALCSRQTETVVTDTDRRPTRFSVRTPACLYYRQQCVYRMIESRQYYLRSWFKSRIIVKIGPRVCFCWRGSFRTPFLFKSAQPLPLVRSLSHVEMWCPLVHLKVLKTLPQRVPALKILW